MVGYNISPSALRAQQAIQLHDNVHPYHSSIISQRITTTISVVMTMQWRIQGGGGGKGGASVPPFGLHKTLRSTDDKLNGTPLSGYRTKKTASMAHLRKL